MTTTAAMDRAVDIGEADAGYDEGRCSASTGNNTKYGQWYGMNCAAWCAMAVSKWFHDAGQPQPASTSKGFAYTPSGAAWYQARHAWAGASSNPERGWVVFFYSASAGRIAHVGVVRGPRGADGLIPTVEGNTNGAGSAEGGSVLLKRRSPSQSLSFRIAGYGRPDLLAGAQEWWTMSIPATELAKIQAQAEEALSSSAGQAAIERAVRAVFSWRPPALSPTAAPRTLTEVLGVWPAVGVPAIQQALAVVQANQATFQTALPELTNDQEEIIAAVNAAAAVGTRAVLDAMAGIEGGGALTDEQIQATAAAIADSLKGAGLPAAFLDALAERLTRPEAPA
jgi:CHAP domain